MIHPFLEEKTVINGMSAGLSASSYDLRIGHDLCLGPNPTALQCTSEGAPHWALAHTLEDLCIPHNVAAYVIDKSTYARRFLSAFNTYIDPGFVGNLTLELVNFGPEEIYIRAGDPICQLTFHWLDQTTDRPYDGKYQNQPRSAVGPIRESGDA
jgi:dCTP deaminase